MPVAPLSPSNKLPQRSKPKGDPMKTPAKSSKKTKAEPKKAAATLSKRTRITKQPTPPKVTRTSHRLRSHTLERTLNENDADGSLFVNDLHVDQADKGEGDGPGFDLSANQGQPLSRGSPLWNTDVRDFGAITSSGGSRTISPDAAAEHPIEDKAKGKERMHTGACILLKFHARINQSNSIIDIAGEVQHSWEHNRRILELKNEGRWEEIGDVFDAAITLMEISRGAREFE
jgi:hypothetical protein